MRVYVFTYTTMAWLMAVTLMMSGATSMASSLRLEEPAVFAGRWQATLTGHNDTPQAQTLQDKPSNTCLVELAPNQTLGKGADCLGAWLSESPIGWFAEPDGIAITGKEGSKIAFFSRQRESVYTKKLDGGLLITLERAAQ
ncbi:AprI/Inh family metalloprotease inhibitor [Pseudomonas moraviensis subsp. stanleyae]|uniref:AprI/Inh family metalloprotease inhibitor n=1 Tax=Pseudomonas moraviensis TaxID=321662 RepID=UPI002E371DC9|nr:AprI/Inh family metalloprotease inhibitor [Pseudomonas moraviensis]MED7666529.1 AprI/Inh family metalloprotease inhibitor [Pseudomonas moraviensis subsp. stanleyae]